MMTSGKREQKSLNSTAFLVEALVLLFFLVASIAIFVQAFGASTEASTQASRLSSACQVAQAAAEEFEAYPAAAAAGKAVGEGVAANGTDRFQVTCDVESKAAGKGLLYTATITVSDGLGEAYSLQASAYEQGGGA